ncbi:Hypothetical predicted protein [Paramuricea clavata]|uniref:Uncharacterized protein n=1 Tax=Paramuricea clavata TaxID=317549 RepID=A0A7D9EVW3_PARCT|nr:Hypothetical predicted protein [Paramuricea clavata]
MKQISIVGLFTVLVIYTFCGLDFKSLGRHQWRCKAKLGDKDRDSSTTANERNSGILDSEQDNLFDGASEVLTTQVSNTSGVKCACGKHCKGLRGLKVHQRSCRFIAGLNEEIATMDDERSEEGEIDIGESMPPEHPELKPGIKLPKSDSEWANSDLFFRAELAMDSMNDFNINNVIFYMSNKVYNYFADNFGIIQRTKDVEPNSLLLKYKEFSKQQLKQELKNLKRDTHENLRSIKYVAKLLRGKLTGKQSANDTEADEKLKPVFNKLICTDYFKTFLRCSNPMRRFNIPSWIPRFKEPDQAFDDSPPTYREISKIIHKMKASGSPCPLDQIPIIVFKKSPYLRSYLTMIISKIWTAGEIPIIWKKAASILIHKSNSVNEPENFRPITLESVH